MTTNFFKPVILSLSVLFITSCSDDNESGSVLFKTSVADISNSPYTYTVRAGVFVELLNDAGTVLETKTTPSNGEVTFSDLGPGNYEWYAQFDENGDGDFNDPGDDGDFTLSEGEEKTVTAELRP